METEDKDMKSILDFKDVEKQKGEKVPNGWTLTIDELKSLKFKSYTKVYDGEEKLQYLIQSKDKTYYAPPIVMSLFSKALKEPGVVKVRLDIAGVGKATRYDLKTYLKD